MGGQGRSRENSEEATAVFQLRDDGGLACSVSIGDGEEWSDPGRIANAYAE